MEKLLRPNYCVKNDTISSWRQKLVFPIFCNNHVYKKNEVRHNLSVLYKRAKSQVPYYLTHPQKKEHRAWIMFK